MRKIKKFLKTPGLFFRDYFNKRYPQINNEQSCEEEDEKALISHNIKLESFSYSNHDFDVDVVFTWVNQNKQWRNDFDYYRNNVSAENVGKYGMDSARFDSHNELHYAIFSVKKNLKWVRKIFIVTNSKEDLPNYLSELNDVIVVSHDQIIDHDYLPTFNSHVIEAHLHKIKGLSEHFIYFNDDVFVGRELPKGHFFQANGLASLYLSTKNLKEMMHKGIMTPTLLASIKSSTLLNKTLGFLVYSPLVHTYVPLKRSAFEKAWNLFDKDIQEFLMNRFRGNDDLNLATFLIPWLMYMEGESSISSEICYYFNIRSPHAKQQYQKLLQKSEIERPHSICANDFYSEANNQFNEYYKQELVTFLNHYFY